MEDACLRLLTEGRNQKEIVKIIGASRSRVSRWCVAAVKRSGSHQLRRLLNTGDQTFPQMLWARIDVRGPEQCWPWLGSIKPNGYGSLNYNGTAVNAHRAVYELLVSAIPADAVVDHICCNTACVNPRHLQCVSRTENLVFGIARRSA